jgi:hypothetical protein
MEPQPPQIYLNNMFLHDQRNQYRQTDYLHLRSPLASYDPRSPRAIHLPELFNTCMIQHDDSSASVRDERADFVESFGEPQLHLLGQPCVS